jgi:hypothetical protein
MYEDLDAPQSND